MELQSIQNNIGRHKLIVFKVCFNMKFITHETGRSCGGLIPRILLVVLLTSMSTFMSLELCVYLELLCPMENIKDVLKWHEPEMSR